jgi:sec-independent protein translocase protein TatA
MCKITKKTPPREKNMQAAAIMRCKIRIFTSNKHVYKHSMSILTVILGFLGGQELLVILIIVLVLFGGRKIPELMRGLGKGAREFNNAKKEVWDMAEMDDANESKEHDEKRGDAAEKAG